MVVAMTVVLDTVVVMAPAAVMPVLVVVAVALVVVDVVMALVMILIAVARLDCLCNIGVDHSSKIKKSPPPLSPPRVP